MGRLWLTIIGICGDVRSCTVRSSHAKVRILRCTSSRRLDNLDILGIHGRDTWYKTFDQEMRAQRSTEGMGILLLFAFDS